MYCLHNLIGPPHGVKSTNTYLIFSVHLYLLIFSTAVSTTAMIIQSLRGIQKLQTADFRCDPPPPPKEARFLHTSSLTPFFLGGTEKLKVGINIGVTLIGVTSYVIVTSLLLRNCLQSVTVILRIIPLIVFCLIEFLKFIFVVCSLQ